MPSRPKSATRDNAAQRRDGRLRRGVHREVRAQLHDRGRDDVPCANARRFQAERCRRVGHVGRRGGVALGRRHDGNCDDEGNPRRCNRGRNPRHEADPRAEVPGVLQVPRLERLAWPLHDNALPGACQDRQGDGSSRRHHHGRHRRRNLHSARDRLRSPAPRRGHRAQRSRHLLVGPPGRHHQRDTCRSNRFKTN